MKKLSLIVALATTIIFLHACGPGAFTISEEGFQATNVCDGKGTIGLSMENGEIKSRTQEDTEMFMLQSGLPSVWCHGLTHQFTGTVEMEGYIFESSASDPLKFMVDRDKGYHYISGKGTVTGPDGEVTVLP